MGDRALPGGLAVGPLDIHMDPLVVAGGFGKGVYHGLAHGYPGAVANQHALIGCQFININSNHRTFLIVD